MTTRHLPPFQQVLDEHGAALWGYCRALLGPDDGADWFQETVLAALRGYRDLRHDANLRAWLFTIAHRRRIDAARAAARRPVSTRAALPEDVATGRRPDADDLPDVELWEAVAALPDKQRAAVTYRYLADLPYAEIGEVIGTTEAAARQNVRAGLATLRKQVTP
ncbi:MAG TPA: sigma-70 family RNA polymerase sigma factor [Acidimicrobiales bacterium]|jgi:RNA polymerase sigma factor (sigma-70 family)|nr:sigma-70 family RNA polymerase sigma factor [Acidimicrobiales bacterium]